MKNILSKELGSKKIGNIQTNTVQLYKPKGKRLSSEDVSNVLKALEAKVKAKGENVQFLIRGLNGDRIKTLKAYNQNLNMKEFDDYYQGLDEENDNFTHFYQLQITAKRYI
jgi:23S rRNA pseudoU1915 N3-methylase RlmH